MISKYTKEYNKCIYGFDSALVNYCVIVSNKYTIYRKIVYTVRCYQSICVFFFSWLLRMLVLSITHPISSRCASVLRDRRFDCTIPLLPSSDYGKPRPVHTKGSQASLLGSAGRHFIHT